MGCVHTHWKRPTIEGCDSLNHIQNIVDKIGENNQKVEKFGQVISQALGPGLKHDKIRAQWVSNTLSYIMLKRVWWSKHSKMKSWKWTICCPNELLKKKETCMCCGSKRSHVALRCCRKGMMLDYPSNAMDYWYTSTLVATLNWCEKKSVAKASQKWRHKMWLMNRYNVSPTTMGQTFKNLVMAKKWTALRICAIWHEMRPCVIRKQSGNNCENPFVQSYKWK